MLRRIAAAHEDHRRIARGAVVAAVFVMLAKVGAVAREVMIAWGYGTSSTVDAFQLSFNVVTWLPVVLAGTSTGLLVPRLVAVRRHGRTGDNFVAELNGWAIAIGLAATLCTGLAAIPAVRLIGKGLAPAVLDQALHFTFVMLPLSFLTVIVALLYVRLQARERQAFAATEAIPPLCVAALILLLPRATPLPLLVGSVAGAVLQVLVLTHLTRRHPEGIGGVSFKRTSPEWHNISRHLLVLMGAQALVALSLPLDNAFASRSGAGGIATYGYATRLLGVFISFGSVVFARAILPVLSDVASKQDYRFGRVLAGKWGVLLFLFGLAAAAVAWVVAPLAVAITFQRGAFTARDTADVAHVFRYGLAQLPFCFGSLATVQWFAATRRYGVILVATAAAAIAKIVFNLLFYPTFGLAGLALGTAAMYAVSSSVMVLVLYWRHVRSR